MGNVYNPYAQQPSQVQYGAATAPPPSQYPPQGSYAQPQSVQGGYTQPSIQPYAQPTPREGGIPAVNFNTGPQQMQPPMRSSSDQIRQGNWNCVACTFSNSPLLPNCEMCGAARP